MRNEKAKSPRKQLVTTDTVTVLKKQFGRLRLYLLVVFFLLLLFQGGVFVSLMQEEAIGGWLPQLAIATIMLLFGGLIVLLMSGALERQTRQRMAKALDQELHQLRAANNRAKSLQAMASTLSASLSFQRVVEVALDVCSLALEEMGISARSLVGAVFLYDRDKLNPVAARGFVARDYGKQVQGEQGIIGEALKHAEPVITSKPSQDPELLAFVAFQQCFTAVCVPLRAGYQIFGAMVLGTVEKVPFNEDHMELFNSIADQAIIALQNAQLYQRLETEKQRIIEADEEARKELARDLHDGPTQSVAAIAMRINFIRSLMVKNPRQAFQELKKVEDLAKQTSQEIRSMLFALRPLVLETQGLTAAIEAAMTKIRESDGLNLRLVGGEYGDLLDEQAQGVVFYIIEEALGNARKYSKASLVEVRLWREGDLFVVRVQDDGVGFDTQSVNANYSSRGSLGMVNMRERAERIDGSLKVESVPGKGTTITLVVPLDKHHRKERA
ncbi:MAG: GAF domain-containing sensor histidine kinase [Chloroflexi bacterium]|nr:GAF domain-containing sensor histidine kinase [Chloroflexota bacterium]MCI0575870.1 GAF domain-containing sensor histidine kinase [Chloroflexota bacterium]MCI0646597.1 GAF domain-containing sensor histidine kinase [Chloroflexota bacterium]MCI0729609.1 GAF domain-containing sensor histidine kinase [Chloroflexota bacterium]